MRNRYEDFAFFNIVYIQSNEYFKQLLTALFLGKFLIEVTDIDTKCSISEFCNSMGSAFEYNDLLNLSYILIFRIQTFVSYLNS